MIFDGKINWTDSRDFFFFFHRVCSGNFPGIVKILPPLPCQQHWAALVVQKKEGLYTRNVLRTLKICGSDIKTGVGLKWILKKTNNISSQHPVDTSIVLKYFWLTLHNDVIDQFRHYASDPLSTGFPPPPKKKTPVSYNWKMSLIYSESV